MEKLQLKKFCYGKLLEIKTNPFYAEILQNLYMGNNGEIISYLQLCYASFILIPFESEYGKIFEQIANDDFLHMKLLARHIVLFGGNPVFSNSKGIWLGGRSIKYHKDIKSILLNNIELKENSLINYKTAYSKIEDKRLKKLITSIIFDEEIHLQKFKDCLVELS